MRTRSFDGLSGSQILRNRFSDLVAQRIDCIIRRKDKRGEETTDDLRREALELYRAVTESPTASHADRIKAQERIDKITNLDGDPGAGATAEHLIAALNAMDAHGAHPVAAPQDAPIDNEDAPPAADAGSEGDGSSEPQ